MEREGVDAELSIAFVDDEEIRRLNYAFLGKNTPTDVMAFPLNEGGEDSGSGSSSGSGRGRGSGSSSGSSRLSSQVRRQNNQIKKRICGEIVVSVQTALNMAERLNTDVEGEIYLYLIHGLLHLMGYDDKDKKMAERMHKEEAKALSGFGFSNNLVV